jgi:transcriptional regulator with XRE-family HTH domain
VEIGKLDIKKIRRDNNLTQQEFADMIDVPIGRVNSWEMRGNTPKVEDYLKIKQLLETKEITYSTKSELSFVNEDNVPLYQENEDCVKKIAELKRDKEALYYTIDVQKAFIAMLQKKEKEAQRTG